MAEVGRTRGLRGRTLGLRGRTVLLAVGVVAVVLLAAGLVFQHELRSGLRSGAVQASRAHLADIVAALERGENPVLAPRGVEVLVQVVPASGPVVGTGEGRAVDAPRLPPGRAGDVRRHGVPGAEPGSESLVLGRGVLTTAGPATVYVGLVDDDATDPADRTRTLGLLLGPVVLAVVAAVAWALVGRTLAPVERMRRSADAVTGRGGPGRVDVPTGDDEVARLGATLNAMLARLEQAQQAQRRFLADAAHELRTPVATLRAQLEAGGAAPELLLAEVERVGRLVEGLLLLSRADADGLVLRPGRVDLDDVVHSCARRARARWPVPVRLPSPNRCRSGGTQTCWSRCWTTSSTTPAGTPAAPSGRPAPRGRRAGADGRRRRPRRAGGGARGGVRPLHAVGQRPGPQLGRAGLGLAIVRDLVTLHGGRVSVLDGPLGGARLQVLLPA